MYFFTGFLGIISWPEFQPKRLRQHEFYHALFARGCWEGVINVWLTITSLRGPPIPILYEYSWKDGLLVASWETMGRKKNAFICLIKILIDVRVRGWFSSRFLSREEEKKKERDDYSIRNETVYIRAKGIKNVHCSSTKLDDWNISAATKDRKSFWETTGGGQTNRYWWNNRCLRLNKKKKRKNQRKEDWTRSELVYRNETGREIRRRVFRSRESLPEAR